ncbi:MAG: hypothetical protein HS111_17055 [Kofleriaceae bacterium]|nr:hypothetical protein [Kofleriaceae bacterium]MCL4223121.1 hypothetical protein [Myxococcales bacterium]
MEPALEALRAALADGATPDQRAAGVAACRAIIAALEATPGEPMPVAASPETATAITAPISLAGLSLDQVLDLAIGKLRSMVPADRLAAAQPTEPPLTIRMFRRPP